MSHHSRSECKVRSTQGFGSFSRAASPYRHMVRTLGGILQYWKKERVSPMSKTLLMRDLFVSYLGRYFQMLVGSRNSTVEEEMEFYDTRKTLFLLLLRMRLRGIRLLTFHGLQKQTLLFCCRCCQRSSSDSHHKHRQSQHHSSHKNAQTHRPQPNG